MNNNNNIEELKALAPTLASIPKENPYKVPMNYFENLDATITKNAVAASLDTIAQENPFFVPANYFDELPGMIEKRIHGLQLEDIAKENPFEVPTGYFEHLNSAITDNVIASKKQKGFEWIGIFNRPKLAVSFATLTLAVFVVFKFVSFNKMNNFSFTEQEIASSQVMNEIDEGTIIETLYSDNKTSANPKQGDIENYLMDNNVDESQITGAL